MFLLVPVGVGAAKPEEPSGDSLASGRLGIYGRLGSTLALGVSKARAKK